MHLKAMHKRIEVNKNLPWEGLYVLKIKFKYMLAVQ